MNNFSEKELEEFGYTRAEIEAIKAKLDSERDIIPYSVEFLKTFLKGEKIHEGKKCFIRAWKKPKNAPRGGLPYTEGVFLFYEDIFDENCHVMKLSMEQAIEMAHKIIDFFEAESQGAGHGHKK